MNPPSVLFSIPPLPKELQLPWLQLICSKKADQKRFIDIGAGVENHIGVSRTKLNTAVAELQEQGYKVHRVNVEQIGIPGQFTIVKVLGAPDTTWQEVVKDVSKIQSITAHSGDYGRTYNSVLGLKPIEC